MEMREKIEVFKGDYIQFPLNDFENGNIELFELTFDDIDNKREKVLGIFNNTKSCRLDNGIIMGKGKHHIEFRLTKIEEKFHFCICSKKKLSGKILDGAANYRGSFPIESGTWNYEFMALGERYVLNTTLPNGAISQLFTGSTVIFDLSNIDADDINEISNQKQSEQKQNKTLANKKETLESDLKVLKKDNGLLKNDIDNLMVEKDALKKQKKDMSKECGQFKKEKDELNAKITELNLQKKELKSDLESLKKDNVCLKSDIDKLVIEKDDLEKQNKDMSKEKGELESYLDKTQRDCLQYQKEIDELNAKISELERQKKELMDKKSTISEHLDSLQKEVEKDYSQFDETVKEISSQYTIDEKILTLYKDKDIVPIEKLIHDAEEAVKRMEDQIRTFVKNHDYEIAKIEDHLD